MQQVALIELFTSEGCSSCPPAEKWLSELTHEKGLWTSFVPVAFHVDYWDQLGWRDSFATRQATERQYEYAKYWGSGSVYTPCFVQNGNEWRHDTRILTESSRVAAGVLTVTLDDNRSGQIEYTSAMPVDGGVDVVIALLGNGIVSAVRSGENAGLALRHDFSVLTFSQVPLEAINDRHFAANITLPKEPDARPSRRAIAVWVVRRGTAVPLQATGGWIRDNEKL